MQWIPRESNGVIRLPQSPVMGNSACESMSKPSYYTTLERVWKNHVAPAWADREISSIRRSEVQDWVSDVATQKSRPVVIRAMGVLAGILDVAIDDRRLASDPARHVRNLPRRGPGKRRVYLSHDQVATLAACSAYPTLILNLAYTGLRWGEATGCGCAA